MIILKMKYINSKFENILINLNIELLKNVKDCLNKNQPEGIFQSRQWWKYA